MQCSNCKNKMTKGLLTGDAQHWILASGPMGKLSKVFNWGINTPRVWAWRCEECKKVEFQSD